MPRYRIYISWKRSSLIISSEIRSRRFTLRESRLDRDNHADGRLADNKTPNFDIDPVQSAPDWISECRSRESEISNVSSHAARCIFEHPV